jgi:hypothetical protein
VDSILCEINTDQYLPEFGSLRMCALWPLALRNLRITQPSVNLHQCPGTFGPNFLMCGSLGCDLPVAISCTVMEATMATSFLPQHCFSLEFKSIVSHKNRDIPPEP